MNSWSQWVWQATVFCGISVALYSVSNVLVPDDPIIVPPVPSTRPEMEEEGEEEEKGEDRLVQACESLVQQLKAEQEGKEQAFLDKIAMLQAESSKLNAKMDLVLSRVGALKEEEEEKEKEEEEEKEDRSLLFAQPLLEAIHAFFARNKPADLMRACPLLAMYVQKVLSHPSTPLYQKIATGNASFRDIVGKLEGVEEVLGRLGYVKSGSWYKMEKREEEEGEEGEGDEKEDESEGEESEEKKDRHTQELEEALDWFKKVKECNNEEGAFREVLADLQASISHSSSSPSSSSSSSSSSLSLSEVMAFVQNGETPPGIQEVVHQPSKDGEALREQQEERKESPSKPWEQTESYFLSFSLFLSFFVSFVLLLKSTSQPPPRTSPPAAGRSSRSRTCSACTRGRRSARSPGRCRCPSCRPRARKGRSCGGRSAR